MIKPIMKDVIFLSQKSEPATRNDLSIAKDLLDTLQAHTNECVGMAANMIGVKKNIIAINMGLINMVMFNPKIIKKSDPYETEEGCLSLSGKRKTVRYKEILVEYEDMNFNKKSIELKGWTAQICQHEIDHLSGIII